MTLPIGANPIPDPGIVAGNFNMMSLENGWPQVRLTSGEYKNNWYHSDYEVVAYPYTYLLFNQMVTLGNLK